MPSLEAVCGRLSAPWMDPEGTVGRIAQFVPVLNGSHLDTCWNTPSVFAAWETELPMEDQNFPPVCGRSPCLSYTLAYVGIPCLPGGFLVRLLIL